MFTLALSHLRVVGTTLFSVQSHNLVRSTSHELGESTLSIGHSDPLGNSSHPDRYAEAEASVTRCQGRRHLSSPQVGTTFVVILGSSDLYRQTVRYRG